MEPEDIIQIRCGGCEDWQGHSRQAMRRTRSLRTDCLSCGRNTEINLASRPDLLLMILAITLHNGGAPIDSGCIVRAVSDGIGKLTLTFQDADVMTINTTDLTADIETLESCGITVYQN
jgi:hypothetical protein